MKTKTWKKAALFSLLTSWSVFTTGCISPAILKAVLGLVEAIFTDGAGGAGGGARTPAGGGGGLNTSNQGGSGLTRNADGSVSVTGPTQPTAPNRGAASGLATDALADANATANGPARPTGPTEATRQAVASLREQADVLGEVARNASAFVSELPNCEAIGEGKSRLLVNLGAMSGIAVTLGNQTGTLENGTLDAAQQAALVQEITGRLNFAQGGMVGDGMANNLRIAASRQMFEQVFANMRAGTPDNQTGSQYVTADSYIGQIWQLRVKANQDCPGAR